MAWLSFIELDKAVVLLSDWLVFRDYGFRVCLPSDALSQHLPSYLGSSYLGRGIPLHGCSSKAQQLLLTLDEGYLLTAAPPDLERGVSSFRPSCAWAAACSLEVGSSSQLLLRRGSLALSRLLPLTLGAPDLEMTLTILQEISPGIHWKDGC